MFLGKIITIEDIEKNSVDGKFHLKEGETIPEHVKQYADNRGIKIIESEIYNSLVSTFSKRFPGIKAEDLKKVIDETLSERGVKKDTTSLACMNCTVEKEKGDTNRAIITTSGYNKSGIIAALSAAIATAGVNIEDISQTIIGKFFTMILVVDLSGLKEKNLTFADFKNKVLETSQKLGIESTVTHEDIIKAMQRI